MTVDEADDGDAEGWVDYRQRGDGFLKNHATAHPHAYARDCGTITRQAALPPEVVAIGKAIEEREKPKAAERKKEGGKEAGKLVAEERKKASSRRATALPPEAVAIGMRRNSLRAVASRPSSRRASAGGLRKLRKAASTIKGP